MNNDPQGKKERDIISIETIEVKENALAKLLNSRSTIELPKPFFNSEDAKSFNEYVQQLVNDCINEYRLNDDGKVLEVHFLNVEYYINQDILSIVLKHDPWKDGIGGNHEVFNFSVSTGKKNT